ncbi:hypothetical protein C8F04DRAFT_1399419, partial [Mycena alexandri]
TLVAVQPNGNDPTHGWNSEEPPTVGTIGRLDYIGTRYKIILYGKSLQRLAYLQR